MIDHDIYFAEVKETLFGNYLIQQQVDGQNAILADWEDAYYSKDLRWLAYALATTYHETAQTMWPIEEYGKGAGMEYGVADPETGECYYGRGYCQLTWRENYQMASDKLGLETFDDLVWYPSQALDPFIAGHIMFRGMIEGWFRGDEDGRQTLERYFGPCVDDAYGAREIINGDKHIIPDWGGGSDIGTLIAGYHEKFLDALHKASAAQPPGPALVLKNQVLSMLKVGRHDVTVRYEIETETLEVWVDGERVL